MEKEYTFDDFKNIIARLRAADGCPWDRVQTHRDCMIEEAYEAAEGIDIYEASGDAANLCEELGDVLLQVVMHVQIAEEEGRFTMGDVLKGISEKMIRRHPHVFGVDGAKTPEAALENWEDIKKKEKHEDTLTEGMRRVAKSLPANIRAAKVQKKAARAELLVLGILAAEELQEVLEAAEKGDASQIFEEFGDLMFSAVNLSRFFNINAENALTNATEKFINRFEYIEETAAKKGLNPENMTIEQMDELWNEIKHLNEICLRNFKEEH